MINLRKMFLKLIFLQTPFKWILFKNLPRYIWLIIADLKVFYHKMFLRQAMSETNKTKKRQAQDPSLEWTHTLIKFLKEQLQEFMTLHTANQSSNSASMSGMI